MQEVAALPSSSLTSGSEPIPANRQPKYSCKKQDRVLRPKNAFILFRSDFYSAQRRISNYQGQNEISRQAGRTWKGLSDEEKRPYCLLAEKEKREHRAKYPDYVYTPGSRTSRPKQKVRAGGITKICSKLQPRIRFESEELESLSSSPYPTRLSPESAESERACSHIETPQPELVENKSEDFSPKLVWASVPTESIPPLKLSVLKIEKVRMIAT
ncbi:HMG-box [Tricholoma matsutake]|nr:HMG-box [Tricholoma matsutake 945]